MVPRRVHIVRLKPDTTTDGPPDLSAVALAEAEGGHYVCTTMAMPMPPPMHSDAIPVPPPFARSA